MDGRAGTVVREWRVVLVAVVAAAACTVAVAPNASAQSVTLKTTSLPSGEVGLTYSQRLSAGGGVGPYTYSVPASDLPSGLMLNSSGLLSGTAHAPATASLPITVTDSQGSTGGGTVSLMVIAGPSVLTTSLPGATVGQPYSVSLSATGGIAPYTWSIGSGPIPGGLVLTSTGVLSGRAGTATSTTVQIKVTDSAGASGTRSLNFTSVNPPLPAEQLDVLTRAGILFSFATGVSGTTTQLALSGPAASLTFPSSGSGQLVVTTAGAVLGWSGAVSLGSIGTHHLDGQVVGIAAPASGGGYWVATSTGHVYGFGGVRRLRPWHSHSGDGRVVGIAAAPSGQGYWLVAASGRVEAFGSARGLGSAHSTRTDPTVAIAAVPLAVGYWLVSRRGTVESFGAAKHYAAVGNSPLRGRVVAIAAASTAAGFWLVTDAGGIYPYGSAQAIGSVPTGSGAIAAAAGST